MFKNLSVKMTDNTSQFSGELKAMREFKPLFEFKNGEFVEGLQTANDRAIENQLKREAFNLQRLAEQANADKWARHRMESAHQRAKEIGAQIALAKLEGALQ